MHGTCSLDPSKVANISSPLALRSSSDNNDVETMKTPGMKPTNVATKGFSIHEKYSIQGQSIHDIINQRTRTTKSIPNVLYSILIIMFFLFARLFFTLSLSLNQSCPHLKKHKFVDIGDALLSNDNLKCLTCDDGYLPDDVS
jgi:hypothetical protein